MKKSKIPKTKEDEVVIGFISNQGITLITLVITIIIMLILSGIVLVLTLGNGGIITKAQEAKKKQIIAEAKEKIGVELLTAQAEAIEKDKVLEQEQIENVISKYGQLQEDGDTIILNSNGYKISLLEIYKGTTITGKSNVEYEAKIAALEQQIETLKKQLKDAETLENDKILYYVSGAVYSSTTSPNGSIVMPSIETRYVSVPDGKFVATTLSNKTILENNKLTLPKGSYTFESFVPYRGATWGAGYKVFDTNGKIIVDHTYTGTIEEFAETNFDLEEPTDIIIYWYRKSVGWYDLTYYKIVTRQ